MSDIGYRKKLLPISDIISDSALSVQYQKFRYQAQSDIADHGYRTKCPPMGMGLPCLILELIPHTSLSFRCVGKGVTPVILLGNLFGIGDLVIT
jgi:hypothetical protein